MCEVMARVRVVLGRSSAQDPPEPVAIRIGNLKLDPERRQFWRGDEEIHLSPKEFDLLALMMKNAGATLSHVKLLRSVWGIEYWRRTGVPTHIRLHAAEEDRKDPSQTRIYCERAVGRVSLPQSGGFGGAASRLTYSSDRAVLGMLLLVMARCNPTLPGVRRLNFRIAKNYRPIGLNKSFQRKRFIIKQIGR